MNKRSVAQGGGLEKWMLVAKVCRKGILSIISLDSITIMKYELLNRRGMMRNASSK